MKRQIRARAFPRLTWTGRRDAVPPAAAELLPVTRVRPGEVDTPPSGHLMLGDNLQAMAALLPTHAESIDLIYADPPFLTGKAYPARVGHKEDSRRPQDWDTADGYRDTWRDPAAYLDMLAPRLRLMHLLLARTGTLYLHLDWHASAYGRLLLDEIFGPERLLNEIVWVYHGPSPIRSAFKRKHDTILVYTKSDRYTFNADEVRVPYDPATRRTFAGSARAGFGKVPDLDRGKVPEDWWYFPVVARLHHERTGYPTQKPEGLLQRVILASSRPGDRVADFFCGSGTAPVVASRLGRHFLAGDASPLAIATTCRRLLLEAERPAFDLWAVPGTAIDADLKPRVRLEQRGLSVSVVLQGLGLPDEAPPLQPEQVGSWEVDWEFDGQVFVSRAQAARLWRAEELDLQLSHVYPAAGHRTVCVRATDRLGRSGRWSADLVATD